MGYLITSQKTAVAILVSVTKKHSSRKSRLRARPVLQKNRIVAALEKKNSVHTGLKPTNTSLKCRSNSLKPKIKKIRRKSRTP